jgi:hypothetical protein
LLPGISARGGACSPPVSTGLAPGGRVLFWAGRECGRGSGAVGGFNAGGNGGEIQQQAVARTRVVRPAGMLDPSLSSSKQHQHHRRLREGTSLSRELTADDYAQDDHWVKFYMAADCGADGALGLKEAREQDFQAWNMAAALMMTVSFGAILSLPPDDDANHIHEIFSLTLSKSVIIRDRDVVRQIYLLAMCVSGVMGFRAVNHFTLRFLKSVDIPAKLYPQAQFYWKQKSKKERKRCVDKFFYRIFPWPHRCLYWSVYWLFVGLVCGIYLVNGPWHAAMPAVFLIVASFQIEHEFERFNGHRLSFHGEVISKYEAASSATTVV